MIPCDYCSKSHRAQEAVEACRQRHEKKAAREQKRAEDWERRVKRWEAEPPEEFILRMHKYPELLRWDQIVNILNHDYPPPQFETKWTLPYVVDLASEHLVWPSKDRPMYWPRERISLGVLYEWYMDKVEKGEAGWMRY